MLQIYLGTFTYPLLAFSEGLKWIALLAQNSFTGSMLDFVSLRSTGGIIYERAQVFVHHRCWFGSFVTSMYLMAGRKQYSKRANGAPEGRPQKRLGSLSQGGGLG